MKVMDRIEVKKAMLSEEWSGRYSSREVQFLLGEDIEKIKLLVKTFDITSCKISDVKKVFFDQKVLFPRSRFKDDYPGIKRVIDIKKADAIIIQKSKIISEFSGFWTSDLYFLNGSTDDKMLLTRDKNMPGVNNTVSPIEVFMPYTMPPGLCDRLNKVLSYKDKNIIDLSQITLHGEEDLDDTAFEKINNLLNAKDEQLKIMGLSLLTGFDYENNKDRISLMLKLNDFNVKLIRKSLTVDIKALLERAGLETSQHSLGSHIIRCCLKHPDDKVYQSALNVWMKRATYDQELPKINITIKSDENEQSENDKDTVKINCYED